MYKTRVTGFGMPTCQQPLHIFLILGLGFRGHGDLICGLMMGITGVPKSWLTGL